MLSRLVFSPSLTPSLPPSGVCVCVSLSLQRKDTLDGLQETGTDTRQDNGLQLFDMQHIDESPPSFIRARV